MFSQSVPWTLNGNGGTVPGTDFIGTTDPADLVFKINGLETFRLLSGGNAGLNIPTPTGQLHLHSPQTVATAGYGAVAPILECCSLAAAIGPITGAFTGFKITNNYTGTTVNDGFLLNENDLDAQILNQENGRVTIGTNNKNVLYMTQTWRIGINEPNPTEQLHVNGNVRVTAIGGSGNGLVTADASGVLGRTAFSGAPGEVLTGAGSWVPASNFSHWTSLGNSLCTDYSPTYTPLFGRNTLGALLGGGFSAVNGTAYYAFNGKRDDGGSWNFFSDGANAGGTVMWGDIFGQFHISSLGNPGATGTVNALDADVLSAEVFRLQRSTYGPGATVFYQMGAGFQALNGLPVLHTCIGSSVVGCGVYRSIEHPEDMVVTGHDGVNAFLDLSDNNTTSGTGQLLINYYSNRNIVLGGPTGGNVYVSHHMGIGTGTFSAYGETYALSVNGNILAKKLRVNTSWADFVFEPGYRLPTLQDIDAYIQQHHHLPEIPTTAEVEERGIEVGEMTAKLLQKIEELTLYVIEQQKQIDALKQSIQQNGGQ